MWRDDLASWEAEIDGAIKELPRLEKAFAHMRSRSASMPRQSVCMNKISVLMNMRWPN